MVALLSESLNYRRAPPYRLMKGLASHISITGT